MTKLSATIWTSELSTSSRACNLGFQTDGDLSRNCTTAMGTVWLDGTFKLEGSNIHLTFVDGRQQTCTFALEETSIIFGAGCEYTGRWYTAEEFNRRTGRG